MSKHKLMFGAIIGAAAGIVAGLLVAPKSGRQTRADLQSKAMELKKKAAQRAQSVKKAATKTKKESD
jgi:gas vesicle protein